MDIRTLLVILWCIVIAAPSHASDERVDLVNVLRQRVADLEFELAEVRRAAGEEWLTERRAKEIRELVSDVLADADQRTAFSDGPTGFYDQGAVIRSEDGRFRLRLNAHVQVRYVASHRHDAPPDDDDTINGFEVTRTRLVFEGHVWEPTYGYRIVGRFEPDADVFRLDEALIRVRASDELTITLGQFKLPFLREELVESPYLLAIERSLVNEAFNQDYAQGVQLTWRDERVRLAAAFSDGFGSQNTGVVSTPVSEYAFTGRAELLFTGTWAQLDDHSVIPVEEREQAVLLGAAAHYQVDDYGTTDVEAERFTWTADVSAAYDGWSFFAAFVANHRWAEGSNDIDQYGAVAQTGVFVTRTEQVFVRGEWGDDDGDADQLMLFTAGVHHFSHPTALRLSVDAGYAFGDVSATWAAPITGWRETTIGEDGQIVLRAQMQLLF